MTGFVVQGHILYYNIFSIILNIESNYFIILDDLANFGGFCEKLCACVRLKKLLGSKALRDWAK